MGVLRGPRLHTGIPKKDLLCKKQSIKQNIRRKGLETAKRAEGKGGKVSLKQNRNIKLPTAPGKANDANQAHKACKSAGRSQRRTHGFPHE